MNNYDAYFEIFGKKLKTTILAKSITDAKQKVVAKIKWHKIAKIETDTIVDDLMDMLGMKK